MRPTSLSTSKTSVGWQSFSRKQSTNFKWMISFSCPTGFRRRGCTEIAAILILECPNLHKNSTFSRTNINLSRSTSATDSFRTWKPRRRGRERDRKARAKLLRSSRKRWSVWSWTNSSITCLTVLVCRATAAMKAKLLLSKGWGTLPNPSIPMDRPFCSDPMRLACLCPVLILTSCLWTCPAKPKRIYAIAWHKLPSTSMQWDGWSLVRRISGQRCPWSNYRSTLLWVTTLPNANQTTLEQWIPTPRAISTWRTLQREFLSKLT